MIGIVISRADDASVHIRDRLKEIADWTESIDETRPDSLGGGSYHERPGFELRTFDALHLHLDRPAEAFSDPDLVVFAARHSGETGPLLTAHFPGNFGSAEYGGAARTLASACPNAHSHVIDSLQKYAPSDYEVGIECTHHGPTNVGTPSMFVEVGSDSAQWQDSAAASAVAKAISDLSGVTPNRKRTVVGFGGGHYAPRFERIVKETDWAVGHIGADWSLDEMSDQSVLEAAFEMSNASRAVLDCDDKALEETIASLGYQIVSETWLRETTNVSLELASSLESELASVDDGLRFGSLASDTPATIDYEVIRPDPNLLSDLAGIDADRTRAAIFEHSLAFESEDGGSRVAGSLAVPDERTYETLLDALCTILAEGYSAVAQSDDVITVTERRFNPSKATALGVPEGPAFGQLAAGNTVEIDGTTVEPADVHEHNQIRFQKRI